MVVDLENSIPYIWVPVEACLRGGIEGHLHCMGRHVNQKLVYKDSSRLLNPLNPGQLIFATSKKDAQFFKDVTTAFDDPAGPLSHSRATLPSFRNKFGGISLFHHFADSSEVIKLIHRRYMQAKNEGKLADESQ